MKRLILLAFFMTSCGPAHHLQKAIEKGAKVSSDTVFQEVITERTVSDTVFLTVNRIFTDTITTETVRWKSKLKIDTVTKTIFQQVECKPDTLRLPVSVTTTIEAGYTLWDIIKTSLFFTALAVLLTILFISRR